MARAKTFKDHYGKRDTIGSKVYHWHYDNSKTTEEEKINQAKAVIDIVRGGAGGTKIKLEGEKIYVTASSYAIIE